jgi:hypothetical protein
VKKVTIKQDEVKPVPTEILANAIVAMAEGVRKLRAGPLNDKALTLLIQHAAPKPNGGYTKTALTTKQIKAVFDGIDALESEYLKKKPAR